MFQLKKLIKKKWNNRLNHNIKKMNVKKMNKEIIIETYDSNNYFYIIMKLYLINLEEYLKIIDECLSIEDIYETLF